MLIVTHLAQVASNADSHFNIRKEQDDEKTNLKIYKLTGKKRVDEIARMLSGSTSSLALSHAEELIRNK